MVVPTDRDAPSTALTTARVLAWVAVWLIAAVIAGAIGATAYLVPPLPPLVIASLTAIVVAVVRRIGRVRAWFDRVDLRALVALHLTRFVGFYFLVLYGRGELPYAFAAVLIAIRLSASDHRAPRLS